MQEAKYSFNLRFNYKGFDSQLTLRADDNPVGLQAEFVNAIARLESIGATPARRWEEAKNGKGNSQPAAPAAPAAPAKPAQTQTNSKPAPGKSAPLQPSGGEDEVCPVHGISTASKFGGLYCPTKLSDGSWCPWRSEAEPEELPF